MGEVWRARDTKLGREVAIKTLPEEFASDADRLASRTGWSRHGGANTLIVTESGVGTRVDCGWTYSADVRCIAASEVRALAGSPDGGTLYYAASEQVMTVDIETSVERALHSRFAVAVDPSGEHVVIALAEQEGVRPVKLSVLNGTVEDIPIRSEFELSEEPIASNAIGPDGRIAVSIVQRDLWFWPVGVLDPETGEIEKAWPDIDTDMFAGWDEDGNLIALSYSFNSSLWRYTEEPQ